jgi:hypothetical protein
LELTIFKKGIENHSTSANTKIAAENHVK